MAIPKRVGPYEIVREIGRGGMGIVYLAREPEEGTLLALKVLPDTWTDDPSRVERFEREAATVMKVRHPNIIPVYSVGSARGVRFIVMKYIEGRSLDRLIRDRLGAVGLVKDERTVVVSKPEPGAAAPAAAATATKIGPPISWCRGQTTAAEAPTVVNLPTEQEWIDAAIDCVEKVARALSHVHQQGIVHRDIKPGNIMIDRTGVVWLGDFGLVHDVEAPGAADPEGAIFGTLQYLAPEQVRRRNRQTDHRSDVFALGVTLYELIALQRPFDGSDTQAILREVAGGSPTPARTINPEVSDDLARVLERAMAKNPEARYQSAIEFADDLRRVRKRRRPVASRSPVLAGVRSFIHRSPAVACAITVLVLLIVGLLEFSVYGALCDRRRILDCKSQAERMFERGDYCRAADGYRVYLALAGQDQAIQDRLRFCEEATAGVPR